MIIVRYALVQRFSPPVIRMVVTSFCLEILDSGGAGGGFLSGELESLMPTARLKSCFLCLKGMKTFLGSKVNFHFFLLALQGQI
jgi:hypothetical protein